MTRVMRSTLGFVFAVLVLTAQAEDRVLNSDASRYHFGPHNAHTYSHNTLEPANFNRMLVEDLQTLQADLESLMRQLEQGDLSGLGGVQHHDQQQQQQQQHQQHQELEQPGYVPVPAEVRVRWTNMQRELIKYFNAQKDIVKLDTKFTLFSPSATVSIQAMISSILTLRVENVMQSFLVQFEKDLVAGKLSTAEAAIAKCEGASNAFFAIAEASSTVRGVLNIVTMGVGSGVGEVAEAFAHLGDQVLQDVSFDSIYQGSSIIGSILEPPATGLERTVAIRVLDLGNSTARIAGDVTYAILTAGIGPLIGFIADRVVKGIELAWQKDRAIAACYLGAFATISENMGVYSSIGAQAVQMRIQNDDDLLPKSAEKFYDLISRAKKEHDVRAPGGGIIGAEDVFEVLDEDFKVISKFRNAADILRGPASGILDTIRQYAVGNKFEQATKLAGTSVVAFLKNCFWKAFYQAITDGSITMDKAGVIKSLEVTGRIPYQTLYERFNRIVDYGPAGEFKDAYGCKVDEADKIKKCWSYCDGDWHGPNYCFIQQPNKPDNTIIRCDTKADCYRATVKAWPSFYEVECASDCFAPLYMF
eukprot:c4520_g1_i1.p1 GENE.c4520_g1_i1~~c4520_g1_i1.p1  ORF type:complete len:603 (+),score=167.07 c4520_g1_i1:45-1811(+)